MAKIALFLYTGVSFSVSIFIAIIFFMKFGELRQRTTIYKRKHRFFLIAGWALGLIFLGFLMARFQPQSIFFLWTAPLHIAIRSSIHSTGQVFSGFTKRTAIVGELEAYKKENQFLFSRLAELAQVKKENDLLRSAVSLNERYSFQTIPADIIKVNSNGFEETATIKWEKGVVLKAGASIISDTGLLLGKLDSFYGTVGQVVLLGDPRLVFNAMALGSEASGIIKGVGLHKMNFELVEKKFDIKTGDILYTSALGGVFPVGLSFGKIKEVYDSDLAGFVSASVESIVDLRTVSKVLVIVDEGNP